MASGLTGGAANITQTIMSSKQMEIVNAAIEVDTAATKNLVSEIELMKLNNQRIRMCLAVGSLASGTKGLFDLIRGVSPCQGVVTALDKLGPLLGEKISKVVLKLLVQTSVEVIA